MGIFLFHPGSAPVVVSAANAPSLWDAGGEWMPAETSGANAYWQASSAPSERTGKPVLCIAIAGKRIPNQLQSGSWTLGRSDWFSNLSPNGASFTFVGDVDAMPNDPIVVTVESSQTTQFSQVFWIGRTDTISRTQDTTGNWWTTISATDVIGILGQAEMENGIPAGNIQSAVQKLALDAGVTLTVDVEGSVVSWPAFPNAEGTVLEAINRIEQTSNAPLFLLGNGRLRAVVRQALAGSVTVIPLTGADSWSSWVEETSVTNVINTYEFHVSSGLVDATNGDGRTASVAAYGLRPFVVEDMLTSNPNQYNDLVGALALTEPRAVVTSAVFPVTDLSQQVPFLEPLDWIDHQGDPWQVMSVQHDASPGGWTVTITADQSQNFLLDTSDPTADDPTPPTGTITRTHTYTSTKSATVASSGGGNGAGDYLAVGLYSGIVARGLIQFPVDWSDFTAGGHAFIRVKKATMTLRTGTQAWVAFGSNPKFIVQRITETWSEGTFTGPAGSQYSGTNAVDWGNQPGATTSGQKVKSIGTSEGHDITVDLTAIAQGWHDEGNTGLRLKSNNEDSKVNTIEFLSDDSAHPPTISIQAEVAA